MRNSVFKNEEFCIKNEEFALKVLDISCGPARPPAYNLSWCCPAGYYTPDCIDFDECSVNNGGCDLHSICTNLYGDFSCGACAWGWNGTVCTNLTDGVVHKISKDYANSSTFNTGHFDRIFAGLYHPNTFECLDSTGWFVDGCINVDDCCEKTKIMNECI